MLTLTLNNQEVETLFRLLDTAVRAQGLQAAAPALALVGKLQEAARISQQLGGSPAKE